MNFAQFVAAYDDIVARARTNKLQLPDFEGTTISLTNPGTVGTLGSVPRLMPGQGAIIATGAIDFPAEFAAASPKKRAPARSEQGADGHAARMIIASFKARSREPSWRSCRQLLQGEDNFYEDIFRDLKVPYLPVRWQTDQQISPTRHSAVNTDVAKEAAVIQLINSYRTRGHLLANTNPAGQ